MSQQREREIAARRALALERDEHGHEIGKNPLKISRENLVKLGHEPKPLLKVIREKCLDCVGGHPGEVAKCTCSDCPNWPYRMGRNPHRQKRATSEEGRQVLRERLKRAREHLKKVREQH
jgi:hypothetical protein